MGLEEELTLALRNVGYADALLALMKNILVDRNALYAISEWAALFDAGLISQGKINDDKLARALDRLFSADRATLQTRIGRTSGSVDAWELATVCFNKSDCATSRLTLWRR